MRNGILGETLQILANSKGEKMKKRIQSTLCALLAVLSLVACSTKPDEATSPPPAVSSDPAGPDETPLAQDTALSLKDDFYDAVNAEWLKTAEIPSDKPVAGGFTDLSDGVEKVLMDDFAAMLEGTKTPENEELASFIEFYRLATDFEKRESDGTAPLIPYLEMIENLTSLEDFASQLAEWDVIGMPAPFAASVTADMGDAGKNALYMGSPGLFLLDKTYYEDVNTKGMLRVLFSTMNINLLKMAGKTQEEAETIVAQALDFDESIVPYTRSTEEASDYTKIYNPVDFAEFDASVESFDFTALYGKLLDVVPEAIVLTDPDYFEALDELVNAETFENLKSWMIIQTVNGFAPYLTEEMRLESGSFMRAISGVEEATSKEKSAYYLASGIFSEVVGLYYGQTYFGEQAKQDVVDMVQEIVETYKSRLTSNTWLSKDTCDMAVKKLDNMTINIGYPDAARDIYKELVTVSAEETGTLIGNAIEFTRIAKLDNYSQLNKPVERGLWPLSADTVNAMYNPMDNSINFPAAILQAPFYSIEQSAYANFGGIGAVIAHEISHAFDPNGSKFNELGSLSNWWTEEDYAKFEELSQAMVEEFDGIEFAGGTVNGAQTVAENVADAGGLTCAFEAAKPESKEDMEAFFTNWAVVWRQKATPEYDSLLLIMDVHAPSKLRANIQLQNIDEFHTTFEIAEGDGMYRAPEDRVLIW